MTDGVWDQMERPQSHTLPVWIAVVPLLAVAAWALLPHHGRQWTEATYGQQQSWAAHEPLPQLSAIHFDPGKAVVPADEEIALDQVAAVLRSDSHVHLRIENYVDPTGAEQPKEDLRAERAVCVATYLQGRGVSVNQITGAGFEKRPPLPSHMRGRYMADFARAELFRVP